MNASNSADASHAAARSGKQTSRSKASTIHHKDDGRTDGAVSGEMFEEEKDSRSLRSHHDEERTRSLTRSNCSQLHRV
jgi:hypothetical protein